MLQIAAFVATIVVTLLVRRRLCPIDVDSWGEVVGKMVWAALIMWTQWIMLTTMGTGWAAFFTICVVLSAADLAEIRDEIGDILEMRRAGRNAPRGGPIREADDDEFDRLTANLDLTVR